MKSPAGLLSSADLGYVVLDFVNTSQRHFSLFTLSMEGAPCAGVVVGR